MPSRRFAKGADMTIYTSGRMTVSGLDMWPRQCLTVPREELNELSRAWEPVLRQMVRSETSIQWMAHQITFEDDWQHEGPLISITLVGSVKRVDLLWDGFTPLPPELDTAVMRTLQIACSHSRVARGDLVRNLPRQLSDRVECSTR
jgi:hypothetical protein